MVNGTCGRTAREDNPMERLFDPPEKRPDHRPSPDGPLAARMRPPTLDEFVGQEHLLGEGSALRAALESGRPPTRPRRARVTGRRPQP